MKKDKYFNFIPYRFKFVGWGVLVLAVLFIIAVKTLPLEIEAEYKSTAEIFHLNALIMGLLLVAWSRDKVEDEMTLQLKIKALARCFVGGIFYVLIMPFADLIIQDPMVKMSAQHLALFMLITYLFAYYLQKFASQE